MFSRLPTLEPLMLPDLYQGHTRVIFQQYTQINQLQDEVARLQEVLRQKEKTVAKEPTEVVSHPMLELLQRHAEYAKKAVESLWASPDVRRSGPAYRASHQVATLLSYAAARGETSLSVSVDWLTQMTYLGQSDKAFAIGDEIRANFDVPSKMRCVPVMSSPVVENHQWMIDFDWSEDVGVG